ncbi:alpha-tocopherol transfer protein-like [Neocloeon triangulifer]|uniref:alpha-tocopherol transfer protein-like n=1 Tax=Neocloeon triangulifer TaxID=2078957 RepID=UPI00286F99C6|nr:alpha-tocopherol transfer protein-like [Neocloeon triangulifer]
MGDDVGNLKIRPLPPDLLEYAKKKLHEVPKRREADVQAIREWFKKQAHINADPDDQLIISFLRGCKFSLEKTKEKFDMYYTMKTMVPELFKNRDLTKDTLLKETLDLGFFFPTGIDDEGRKVYFCIGGKDDPAKHLTLQVIKVNFMMMDYFIMNDDVSVVKGVVIVNDMSAMKLGHATQFMPSLMKKVSVCSEEGYPFRPQAMHVINIPSFMETLLKLFQSFNKEKMNRRMHAHGKDLESLFKAVPKRTLPMDFGGDAPSSDKLAKEFSAKILDFNDWYVADEKNGVDEKKRVGRSRTKEDLFGMEGSFRQLTLD